MKTDALKAMKFETLLNDILIGSENSGKLVLPAEELFQFVFQFVESRLFAG